MKLLLFSVIAAIATNLQFALAQVACGTEDFTIAGSTTVAPLAREWAAGYYKLCSINITVEEGGSSAGADRLCDNSDEPPIEIGDLSRPFDADEAELVDGSEYIYQCLAGDTDRSAISIEVAIDGVSVVTAANGAGAACIESLGGLTVGQLRWIFSSYTIARLRATGWNASSVPNSDGDDDTHLWSELDASCPAAEIKIAGPDTESGTYEYFQGVVLADSDNGESFGTRPDGYFNSTNITAIATYVEGDPTVVGFFNFASYLSETGRLFAAPILNEAGVYVAPSRESLDLGSYTPLSRRLFMNVLNDPESLSQTAPFILFGMSDDGTELVSSTGYVPIPEADRAEMINRITGLGSNATIEGGDNSTDTNTTETTEPPVVNSTTSEPEPMLSDAPSLVPSDMPSMAPVANTSTEETMGPTSMPVTTTAPTMNDTTPAEPAPVTAPAPVAPVAPAPVPRAPSPPTAAGSSSSTVSWIMSVVSTMVVTVVAGVVVLA